MQRLLALTIVLWTAHLFAHSGGLDRNGCHTNRKTKQYHCHGSPKTGTPKPVPPAKPKPRVTTSHPAVGTASPSETKIEEYYFAEVMEVEDGDTVIVKWGDGSKRVTIRLFGIDCPEGKQQSGDSAKRYVTNLIKGKRVFVSTREVDSYGRTVAVLRIGEDSASELILRAGWGWWYKKYAPRESNLEQAETEARRNKRGLWAYAFPIAPWEYRWLYPETLETPARESAMSSFRSVSTQDRMQSFRSRISLTR